jgi:1,4-alpha-glucan branching enzyme
LSGEQRIGDIAIVLHSHMPYVEGFGTYPFGEEWLFDAVLRSYLPVLEIAAGVTMSVTPVLADQLEDEGVQARMLSFARRYRLGSARLDAEEMGGPELRAAAAAEGDRYAAALAGLERTGGDMVAAFATAQREERIELIASCATHGLLPLIATQPGRRLQVDTGLRSHRRRFGPAPGFWLPECAYEPGLERLLAEHRVRYFCTDQSAHEPAGAPPQPVACGSATAFPIDWEAIEWLWSLQGYPSDPGYADFHRKSWRGIRPWSIDGTPYQPRDAADRAREQGRAFAEQVAKRLGRHREACGQPGLLTFAIDTELLGHWWWEGPHWLESALAAFPRHGVQAVTLGQARKLHAAEARPLRSSSWGEGKDLRTWDSPPVADLAWGARRLELRVLRELGSGGLRGPALRRAARELLAVQASDWAFLDYRKQAGDYPYRRALGHARELFEALDSGPEADPQLRNLAPDLDLAPLLEP